MRGLDLFSGIGGASIAMQRAGIEVAAHAEIEPFPCKVLEHRFPEVPNLGDVVRIVASDIWRLGKIDVVSFGSPCQDWSVAGKRLGLKGHRSSLFHEAIRIIRLCRPGFAVFENVPGLFSSAGGWDFAAVLDEMAESGALDIAWRVLDAQWFGVPQRRRRIFLVADFGGERAGEILSISEGVFRHPAPGKEARSSVTALSANGVGTCGADDNQAQGGHLVSQVAPPIRSNYHSDHDGDEHRLIPEVTHPLTARHDYSQGAFGLHENQRAEMRSYKELAPELMGGGGKPGQGYPAVAQYFETRVARNGRGAPSDVANALKAEAGQTGKGDASPMALQGMAVRRLTPTECERLQGFPDGWTDIPGAPDSARYRALGNAWAVPVGAWVMQRVKENT